MNYLIVCKSNAKHYLLMADDSAVQAFTSTEEVMKSFGAYTEAFNRTYESRMSACIGMIQMQPVAIKAPENIEDIKPFITEMRVFQMSGGAIGRGYKGIPVSESILELKEFDVFNQSLKESDESQQN